MHKHIYKCTNTHTNAHTGSLVHVILWCSPVIEFDHTVSMGDDRAGAEEEEVYRVHHGHHLGRDSTCLQLSNRKTHRGR